MVSGQDGSIQLSRFLRLLVHNTSFTSVVDEEVYTCREGEHSDVVVVVVVVYYKR